MKNFKPGNAHHCKNVYFYSFFYVEYLYVSVYFQTSIKCLTFLLSETMRKTIMKTIKEQTLQVIVLQLIIFRYMIYNMQYILYYFYEMFSLDFQDLLLKMISMQPFK